jgi:uncharacterized protein with PIN domain
MIVVDPSALNCVLLRQPGWESYDAAIRAQPAMLAGLAHRECIDALHQAGVHGAQAHLDAFMCDAGIEVQRFSKRAAAAGANAWQRYGNGAVPGGLTLAQAMTFALARTMKAPILAIGATFDQTPAKRVVIDSTSADHSAASA